MENKQYLAFDVETTGLRPYHGDRTFTYCLGDWDGHVTVVRYSENASIKKKQIAQLQSIMNNPTIAIIAHNLKFELSLLQMDGITVPVDKELHDTMVMHQILNNLSRRHGLDEIAYDLCGYDTAMDKEVKRQSDAYGGYHKVNPELMKRYQVADGERTMMIFRLFYPELMKVPGRYEDYLNEIALIRTTQRMEALGVYLDKEESNALLRDLKGYAEEVEQRLVDMTGEWINFSSSVQVSNLLYNKMSLPVLKYSKTGKPSVDEEAFSLLLEALPDNKVLNAIMEYRGYVKSIGMINGYFLRVDSAGMLHPSIKTNHAATGREACENPNLQNVRKGNSSFTHNYSERRCVGCKKGFHMAFVDYAGIELRLIAALTGEPEMVELIRINGDPHALAAQILYKGKKGIVVSPDTLSKEIWKEFRSKGKNAQFAKCYGAGLPKVSATLGLTEEEAYIGFSAYCVRFPLMAYFTDNIIDLVRQQGFVETPFHRRLSVKRHKPHEGANYLIQGTAAGILKRAQVHIDAYCKKQWSDKYVRPILPIHDEICFSIMDDVWHHRNQIIRDISSIMIDMPEIKTPLDVEWKYTKTTWDKAEEIQVYRSRGISKIRRVP